MSEVLSEKVNHPKHYNSHPSGIECIDIIELMSFNLGNCVKYFWRMGLKESDKKSQDLNKSLWYLEREIERLKKFKQKNYRILPEHVSRLFTLDQWNYLNVLVNNGTVSKHFTENIGKVFDRIASYHLNLTKLCIHEQYISELEEISTLLKKEIDLNKN